MDSFEIEKNLRYHSYFHTTEGEYGIITSSALHNLFTHIDASYNHIYSKLNFQVNFIHVDNKPHSLPYIAYTWLEYFSHLISHS